MLDSIVTIAWPTGEPCWLEVIDDAFVFGDVDLVRNLEDNDCARSAINEMGSGEFWPELNAKDRGWLVGREPWLLAPSVGSHASSGKSEKVLILWELVDAEEGFVLPSDVCLAPEALKAPIFSKRLETRERPFRLFPANELWGGVEARPDHPVFYFSGQDFDLSIFDFELIQEGLRGRFLLHVITGGFERCVWEVSPDQSSPMAGRE